MRAQGCIRDDFVESSLHAEHPGVALGLADLEVHMTLPQAGMPTFLRIELGTAKPFAEIALQNTFDRSEIVRMHCADARGFRQSIHAVIEGIHQPIDCGLAADLREQRRWRKRTGHDLTVFCSLF